MRGPSRECEEGMQMRGRVGATDRAVRVLVGGVALLMGLTQAGSIGAGWAYVADAVGVIGLVTGLVGRCPLYALCGVETCGKSADAVKE
ncbi:MAG TPA: DUF2892 domain-containing protein [bacterium]|nr:DUF2892 domain-containing protein [bacterium]